MDLSSTPYKKMSDPASRLSAQTLWIFGCGAIPPAVKADLLNNYLFYYYNQVLLLSSGLVATASAMALVVDAIMDPLIGWVSDRTISRFGRRHPFLFASLLPSALSYYALLTLRSGAATQEQLFAQLFGLLCALRISWALYEVPRGALAPEICKGYDERTALHGISMACGWLGGGLMSYATKQVFLGKSYDDPQGYDRLAHWGSGMLFIFSLIFACCSPYSPSTSRHSSTSSSSSYPTSSDEDGSEPGESAIVKGACANGVNAKLLHKPPSSGRSGGGAGPDSLRGHVRDALHTLSHSDFLAILLAGLVYNLYLGVTMGLGAYVNKFLWQWKPQDTALYELVVGAFSLVVSLCARQLSARYEKRDLAIRLFSFAIAVGPMHLILRLADRWLGVQILPRNGAIYGPLWWCLLLHSVATTVPSILGIILLSSMVSDVVEDSQSRTGRRAEGLFFAAPALLQKSVSGFGFVVKGYLLRATGFSDAQTDAAKALAIERVAFAMVVLALILPVTAVALLARYRISRYSHQRNLVRLGYAEADAEAEYDERDRLSDAGLRNRERRGHGT